MGRFGRDTMPEEKLLYFRGLSFEGRIGDMVWFPSVVLVLERKGILQLQHRG